MCTDTSVLLGLNKHVLNDTFQTFSEQLPSSEGLIIRPAVTLRTQKTKRKYNNYERIKASSQIRNGKKQLEIL